MAQPKGSEAPVAAGLPGPEWRRRAAAAVALGAWLYLVVVLGVAVLLRMGDLWWPATLLLFSPRWLLALPPILLLPAAAALRRPALGPLLLSLVLVAGPVMGFCVPWQRLESHTPAGTGLRVLTCNMHYGAPDPAPLNQLLTATRPDVVALQEWRQAEPSKILAAGPWHVCEAPGLFLASRYPIRRDKLLGVDSSGAQGTTMRYELETPAGVVTLFSLHFFSPRDGLEEVVHGGSTGAQDLRTGSALRWEQSDWLARQAGAVAGPVLLVGDFNTPPESVLFRRVWGRYRDAFAAAGWGWGYTLLSRRTLVRIDHILAGPGWHCDRCWVGPNVGSLHRPVLADLTWPAANAP